MRRGAPQAAWGYPRRAPAKRRGLLEPDERREHDVQADERQALEEHGLAVAGHLPERDRGQRQRTEVDRLDHEREALGEEQREDDEHRPEEAGDLRDRVLDDRDREVVLALPGELDG